MNPAAFSTMPDACSLGTQGSDGPDRISQLVYDAAGQVTQVKVAVGTTDAATERTLTYTNNGLVQTLKDAESNLTTYEYDGFDRLSKTRYPLPTKGANASSTIDYEQMLNYDANSNVGQRRLRDGTLINFTYDNLDRVTVKDLPGTEPDVTYGYDNLGRLTSANQNLNNLSFGYDALSRKTSEGGPLGNTSFGYDPADERISITYSTNGGGSALTVNYAYLLTGDLSAIIQSGSNLATYAYDNLGNRTSVTFGNGTSEAFTYDAVSRLSSLTNDLSGTANDLTINGIGYNPASQLKSVMRSNDAHAFTPLATESITGVANGLNQLTSYAGKSLTYTDQRGNLTGYGTETFGYSSENLLTSGPNSTSLSYDPGTRLYQTSSGASTARFAYDDFNILAEYNSSNALQRRFIYDDADQPVVWYEGMGTSSPRFLSQDERGSIISVTDGSGTLLGINSYDEYGVPGASNLGRFGYTGQAWLPEVSLLDLSHRMYSPGRVGRFLQTDPIGYAGGVNLYAYVGNDPANFTDPLGLICTGSRIEDACSGGATAGGFSGSSTMSPEEHWNNEQGMGNERNPLGALALMGALALSRALSDIIVTRDRPAPHDWPVDPSQVDLSQLTADIIVTCDRACADRIHNRGKAPFYFNGKRWVADPYYRKPWYSNYFDACFVVCPPLIAGIIVGPEFVTAAGTRIAPFGNRTRRLVGQLPHYHRRVTGPDGKTLPGQGIHWHRPWERFP